MIKESDLVKAIAECQGEKNPNANTCIKLAAYYTILNNLKHEEPQQYSYANKYDSGSEFSNAVKGRSLEEIMPVMDELMTSIQVLFPKMYRAVIQRLKET